MDFIQLIEHNIKQEQDESTWGTVEPVSNVWRYFFGELNDVGLDLFEDRKLEKPEDMVQYTKNKLDAEFIQEIQTGYRSNEPLEQDPEGYLTTAIVLIGEALVTTSDTLNLYKDDEDNVYVNEMLIKGITQEILAYTDEQLKVVQRLLLKRC